MKLKDLYKIGKTHIVDTTAALVVTTPVYAFFENVIVGMSDKVSLNSRLLASGIMYAGLGSAISRGRDLSRKLFKIKDTTKERIQTIHDIGYLMFANLFIAPGIYVLSGANTQETIKGTAIAMGFSVVNGPLFGYAVDAGRDLMGIKSSERVPRIVRNLPSKVKKSLAIGLTAGLIGLNGLIYHLTPNPNRSIKEGMVIEQTIQQNSLEKAVLEENQIPKI